MPGRKVDPALKARSYPISLRQAAIDDLNAIKAATGESHGGIVTRLVTKERRRLERKEQPK